MRKPYEMDPLGCADYGAAMSFLAVITDPQQLVKILRLCLRT